MPRRIDRLQELVTSLENKQREEVLQFGGTQRRVWNLNKKAANYNAELIEVAGVIALHPGEHTGEEIIVDLRKELSCVDKRQTRKKE